MEPNARTVLEVRSHLPADRLYRRNALGVGLVMLVTTIWCCLLAAALLTPIGWFKWLLGTLLGICTGVMFVLGHDACHQSLTSHRRLNHCLAWLAFLPSLHPPTSWEWGHNRMHHSWTNLSTKDDGYPPLSWAQWQTLHPIRKLMFRFYYTLPGIGFYYMIEIWLRKQIYVSPSRRTQLRTATRYYLELVSLVGFVSLQFLLVQRFGAWHGQGWDRLVAEVMACMVWPFIVWNTVMAFVTIQHHTHLRVRWFDNEADWSFYQSQVAGTVHMVFPTAIRLGFANIFEHTAHHVDKHIPFYNLLQAQQALESTHSDDVIVQRASLRHLREILKRCRLYDYREGRWMDFSAQPTSPSN